VIFNCTTIEGVVVVDLERRLDDRGFFARTWCAQEFGAECLPREIAQCSISWNDRKHTLRGIHWQAEPFGEGKLIRCTAGAILDVAVDIRPESPTFLSHLAFELTSDNRRAVFLAPGIGHAFLTLTDGAEVLYQMDTPYAPTAARGARWDDPAFSIAWPTTPAVISDRDRSYPDYFRAGSDEED